MATRIGVGVISKSNNAEIELLRTELNLVRAENETLMAEKLDLEKISKELKEKVDNLENQVKELTEKSNKKNQKNSDNSEE